MNLNSNENSISPTNSQLDQANVMSEFQPFVQETIPQRQNWTSSKAAFKTQLHGAQSTSQPRESNDTEYNH